MRCSVSRPEFRLPRQDRPNGVHLSGLVKAALKAARLLPDYYLAPMTQADVLRMAVGLAWEDWYGPQIPGAVYHPGSFLYQGVWFSPDALDLDEKLLHEIKVTSTSGDLSRNLYWNLQLQGYLWCLGEGEWTRARLHCLRITTPPYPWGAELVITDVEYNAGELRSTWENVLSPYIDVAEKESNHDSEKEE